jgi:hypothetical protein
VDDATRILDQGPDHPAARRSSAAALSRTSVAIAMGHTDIVAGCAAASLPPVEPGSR